MPYFLTLILYLLIIFVLPLFSEKCIYSTNKYKILNLICVSIVPGIVAGFRGNSGTDTLMYKTVYQLGSQGIKRWVQMENGYLLLNDLFSSLHFPFSFFLFFMSTITTLFILLAINLEREYVNVYISSMTYFTTLYFQSFNFIRQALAISISLFAMVLFLHKKFWIAIPLIILAAQIHRTAYICLLICVFYLFIRGKNKGVKMIITLLLFFLIVINQGIAANIVFYLTRNNYYVGYITRQTGNQGNLLTYMLKTSPVLVLCLLYYRKIRQSKNANMIVYLTIMLTGYLLSALGVHAATEVNRIGLYFTMMNVFVFGYCSNNNLLLPKVHLQVDKKIIKLALVLFLAISFFNGIFIHKNQQIVPYRSNPTTQVIFNG